MARHYHVEDVFWLVFPVVPMNESEELLPPIWQSSKAVADSARRFATTRWNLVLAAGEEGTSQPERALESLCAACRYPLYAFLRRDALRGDGKLKGTTEAGVNLAVLRLRRCSAQALRAKIQQTVASPEEADEAIPCLFAAVGG